jgi:Ca-activated chloride channel homolog
MDRRSFLRSIPAGIALANAPLVSRALGQQPGPIKVSVNEVIVPVTVTDEKGRFVSNLEKKDFHIFDEGKEQRIDYFTSERNQPVVVGFLLDMSNAMKIHWKKYEESVTELVLNLLPNDPKYAGYLITYGNEKPELQVDTTIDSEKIVEKIRKLKPAGGAAFYDALYMACANRKLIQGEPYEPRRVIIVIGDGHDSASKKSLAEVLEVAQRKLVTIYGMSSVAFGFTSEGEDGLLKLAEETGGRVEYPLNNLYKDVSGYLSTPSDDGNYALTVGTGGYAGEIASGIFKAISNISGEVTTQYIMRYNPDVADKGSDRAFRRLKVSVDLLGVKVRYRTGYYPNSI